MSDGHTIHFGVIPWEPLSQHSRQKRIVIQDRIVRLLELDVGFEETDWCRKSHVGYVVGGELRLIFMDRSMILQAGDALVLAGDEDGKHKAAVVRGQVTLFLVESV